MKQEVKDFERIDLFNHYNSKYNPFIFLTTKVDITNIYNKCKNHYASIGYFITLAANKIDNFKYRNENGKIYKYDILKSNFTIMFEESQDIWFFTCEPKDNYNDFIKEFKSKKDELFNNHRLDTYTDDGELWFSCTPWYNFSSLITPFDKSVTIPQFLWDKFSFESDRCYINLMIMAHHGFVDGYHIKLFLDEFNKIVENIDDYLKEN